MHVKAPLASHETASTACACTVCPYDISTLLSVGRFTFHPKKKVRKRRTSCAINSLSANLGSFHMDQLQGTTSPENSSTICAPSRQSNGNRAPLGVAPQSECMRTRMRYTISGKNPGNSREFRPAEFATCVVAYMRRYFSKTKNKLPTEHRTKIIANSVLSRRLHLNVTSPRFDSGIANLVE